MRSETSGQAMIAMMIANTVSSSGSTLAPRQSAESVRHLDWDELDLEFSPERSRNLVERGERDGCITGIKDAINCSTRCPHFRRQLRFVEILLLHQVGDFQGECTFQRGGFHFLEEAIFFQEIVKAAAAMSIPGLCRF